MRLAIGLHPRLMSIFMLVFLSASLSASTISSCATLNVAGGSYVLNQSVSANGSTCFTVSAANITLDCNGFAMTGNLTTATYGVYSAQFNTTVKNCNISNFAIGIFFSGANNGTINNTNISSAYVFAYPNGQGVFFSGASYNRMDGVIVDSPAIRSFAIYTGAYNYIANSVANVSGSITALTFYLSSNNTVTNFTGTANGTATIALITNSSYNNFTGVNSRSSISYGLSIDTNSNFNRIADSTMSGGTGLYITTSNNTVTNSTGNSTTSYGIQIGGANNTIANCTGLSASGSGILLSGAYNTIANSTGTALNAGHGIYISSSVNGTVSNSIGNSGSGIGVYLYLSSNNTIANSTGNSSSNYGVYVLNSTYNALTNITGTSVSTSGVSLSSSSVFNTIANSRISGRSSAPKGSALSFSSNSSNNTVANSTIDAQTGSYAIAFQTGYNTGNSLVNNTIFNGSLGLVYLDANASRNLFYWNNLSMPSGAGIGNGMAVYDLNGSNLYNSTEGNIWPDVIHGAVNISGAQVSSYSQGYYVGTGGSGYPLNSSSSVFFSCNFSGCGDYAPLVPTTAWAIAFPFDNVVVQEDAAGNGVIIINGSVNNISTVGISYNGSQANLTVAGGRFYGNITLPAGQYDILLYDAGNISNNHTIYSVGVGEVIIASGQSNAVHTGSVGYNTTYVAPYGGMQVYTASTSPSSWQDYAYLPLTADERWAELAHYAAATKHAPVMLLNIAVGGQPISSFFGNATIWRQSVSRVNYFTGGTMKARAVIFNQGESDIGGTEAYYLSALQNMTSNLTNEFVLSDNKVAVCQILKGASDSADPQLIRNAQQRSWSEISYDYRGAIMYDIQLGAGEVHPSGAPLTEHSRRLSWAGIEQIYGNATYSPAQVSSVAKINSTALSITYSAPVSISNWSLASGARSYGYLLANQTANATDSNVLGTALAQDNLTLTVNFNTSISSLTNLSICTGFTCYGKAIARTASNGLPPPITISMNFANSSPSFSLLSPASGLNTTETNVSFSWNATGGFGGNYSCSLYVDGALNQSGIAAVNNSLATAYATSNLSYGAHNWSVTCADDFGNSNSSPSIAFQAVQTVVSGNGSNINTTLPNVTATINGTNVSSGTALNATLPVNISSAGVQVLLFTFNFSNSSLNFSAISINNTTVSGRSFFSVSGIPSSAIIGGKTITIYGINTAYGYACVKDEENVNSITLDCTGATETSVACDGVSHSGYTCTISGTTLSVSGLNHSGVQQYQPPATSTNGDGTGGARLSLSQSFNCSSGVLRISATSATGAVSGVEVRLYKSGTRDAVSGKTDSSGSAYFPIAASGKYYVETPRASPYSASSLDTFSVTSCAPVQQPSVANQTAPVPPLQQPANSTQPAINPTQPAPQAQPQQPAQKPAENPSLPVEIPQITPEVRQAVADNALPGAFILAVGAGMALIAAGVLAYLKFGRKKGT